MSKVQFADTEYTDTSAKVMSIYNHYRITDSGIGDMMDSVEAFKKWFNPLRPAVSVAVYQTEGIAARAGASAYARRISDSGLVYPTLVAVDSHGNTLAVNGPHCGLDHTESRGAWVFLKKMGFELPLEQVAAVQKITVTMNNGKVVVS